MREGTLGKRLSKLEEALALKATGTFALFGKSHDDVEAQRLAMIRSGKAADRDGFVKFITIYEERPR